MKVLYHIRPYFWGIYFLHRPYIGLIFGRYLQFRILKWPLNKFKYINIYIYISIVII
jgi:hypothetical protein